MQRASPPIRLSEKGYTPHCATCRVSSICVPAALTFNDINELDAIIHHKNLVHKDDFIYRENDDFSAVYAVRVGSVKVSKIDSHGDEHITGFYFPGEIFGIEGLSTASYQTSAAAMETTSICRINFDKMAALSQRISSVQRYFFNAISNKIADDQQLMMWLSKRSAQQRVILLLLAISSKYARIKMSASEFTLPMSRTDFANYVGLTIETTSRIFGKLQDAGLITSLGKSVTILDLSSMTALAEDADEAVSYTSVVAR